MLCKYRLVIKIALDKCHPIFILTKDLLSVFLLFKKLFLLAVPFNLALYRLCAAAYYDIGLFSIRNSIITH